MLFEVWSDPSVFDGLKIMQGKTLCEKYIGKFHVISISLKNVDSFKYERVSLTTMKGYDPLVQLLSATSTITDEAISFILFYFICPIRIVNYIHLCYI